jgi:hypothetical protein
MSHALSCFFKEMTEKRQMVCLECLVQYGVTVRKNELNFWLYRFFCRYLHQNSIL